MFLIYGVQPNWLGDRFQGKEGRINISLLQAFYSLAESQNRKIGPVATWGTNRAPSFESFLEAGAALSAFDNARLLGLDELVAEFYQGLNTKQCHAVSLAFDMGVSSDLEALREVFTTRNEETGEIMAESDIPILPILIFTDVVPAGKNTNHMDNFNTALAQAPQNAQLLAEFATAYANREIRIPPFTYPPEWGLPYSIKARSLHFAEKEHSELAVPEFKMPEKIIQVKEFIRLTERYYQQTMEIFRKWGFWDIQEGYQADYLQMEDIRKNLGFKADGITAYNYFITHRDIHLQSAQREIPKEKTKYINLARIAQEFARLIAVEKNLEHASIDI